MERKSLAETQSIARHEIFTLGDLDLKLENDWKLKFFLLRKEIFFSLPGGPWNVEFENYFTND